MNRLMLVNSETFKSTMTTSWKTLAAGMERILQSSTIKMERKFAVTETKLYVTVVTVVTITEIEIRF